MNPKLRRQLRQGLLPALAEIRPVLIVLSVPLVGNLRNYVANRSFKLVTTAIERLYLPRQASSSTSSSTTTATTNTPRCGPGSIAVHASCSATRQNRPLFYISWILDPLGAILRLAQQRRHHPFG
jgi:hypothetical protein